MPTLTENQSNEYAAWQAIRAARAALQAGDRRSARRWAERAAALAPQLEESWLFLAAVSSPLAALSHLRRALAINPASPRALTGLSETIRQANSRGFVPDSTAGFHASLIAIPLPGPEPILLTGSTTSLQPSLADTPAGTTHRLPSTAAAPHPAADAGSKRPTRAGAKTVAAAAGLTLLLIGALAALLALAWAFSPGSGIYLPVPTWIAPLLNPVTFPVGLTSSPTPPPTLVPTRLPTLPGAPSSAPIGTPPSLPPPPPVAQPTQAPTGLAVTPTARVITVSAPPGAEPTRVPATATQSPTAAPTAAPTQAPTPAANAAETTYTVRRGDTLNKIAMQFGLDLNTLARANHISNPSTIYAGQRLVIPAGGLNPEPAGETPASPSSGGKYILVDISEQHLYAYEGEKLVFSFIASTGSGDSTRTGQFSVLNKIPNAYGGNWNIWMPDWLGIYWAGNLQNGIHSLPILPGGGRLWSGNLGTPVSYGCIILGLQESKQLYNWAEVGTPVEIRR